MRKYLAIVGALLSGQAAQAQQVCNDRITQTTASSRFLDHGDGSVDDLRTGLVWQRCPLGFTYSNNGTPTTFNDDTCAPNATSTYTWQAALQAVAALNTAGGYAGRIGWRLPNIKELASLVEMQCASPASNLLMFPGVPANAGFFSSSPSATGSSSSVSIFMLQHSSGVDMPTLISPGPGPALYVRLVFEPT